MVIDILLQNYFNTCLFYNFVDIICKMIFTHVFFLQSHRYYLQSNFDICLLYNLINIICKVILTYVLFTIL